MKTSPAPRRPPLWLASAVLACGWGAAYSVALWVFLFTRRPVHEDVRMTYVAAEAGLRYSWSTIYDESVLRSLYAVFSIGDRLTASVLTYFNPPLLAWLLAALTVLSEPVSYFICTLSSPE